MNTFFYYKMMGFFIKSDIYLPGIPVTVSEYDNSDQKLNILSMSITPYLDEIQSAKASYEEANEAITTISYGTKDEQSMWVENIGYYKIYKDRICYALVDGADLTTFQQWLTGMAFALVLIMNSELNFHGANIVSHDGTKSIIISGESGSGKSTIANELLKQGYLLSSDDTVFVKNDNNQLLAIPSFPQRRLCMDVVEREHLDKSKLIYFHEEGRDKVAETITENFYDIPSKLSAMFIFTIADSNTPLKLSEITGHDKLKVVMNQMYKRNTYQALGISLQLMQTILKFCQDIPVYEISRPDNVDTLHEVLELIKSKI